MPMHLHTHLPSLQGATEWINGQPELETLQEKPLLIYFWAVSCHVCHENVPRLNKWREKYVPKGLGMISIHCPRMKSDTDLYQIRAAVQAYEITEPCAVDNLHKIKRAFENELWPAYYLFDQEGNLKRRSAGKNGLSMLEPLVEEMTE